VQMLEGPDKLAEMVRGLAKPGDFVMCLGAGTITQWAYDLPKGLGGVKSDKSENLIVAN
jgi:UDP-N-acetylmuramate--alanine ligase